MELKGSRVLVHSIGPNGVYANVVGVSNDRIQVKYYDARDGGDIVIWVSRGEVLTMPGDTPQQLTGRRAMTGEDLMMLADDISMQGSALDTIGHESGDGTITEKQHDQAIRHCQSLEMALSKLYDDLGSMVFGPCPDEAYENYREARAEEELHRGAEV